jgi:RNA polymerase sigma-70 factor, ECF subfamily
VSCNPRTDFESDSYRDLLSAARTGSSEALGTLLESCRTYLLYVGVRELSAELQIKVAPSDLVQETFSVGHRAIASFHGSTRDDFRAWLRGILVHKAANARRRYLDTASRDLLREERQPDHSSIARQANLLVDNETPSRAAMRKERSARVQLALAALPAHYREVIRLRNFELLEFEDIASIMNRSADALRALWLRAIQRLKKDLDCHDL